MKIKSLFTFLLIGFIKIYAQDTVLVPMQNVKEKYRCFLSKKDGLIRSVEEAKSNIYTQGVPKNSMCYGVSADSFNLDFTKNGVIFIHVNTGSCEDGLPTTTTFLYKIISQKKYLLIVKVHCKETKFKVHRWTKVKELVPKFESNYTFEYKIQK